MYQNQVLCKYCQKNLLYKDLRVKFYFLENPMLLKNIHHAETFPASYLDNKDFLHH